LHAFTKDGLGRAGTTAFEGLDRRLLDTSPKVSPSRTMPPARNSDV
jgi:hypothetical protein